MRSNTLTRVSNNPGAVHEGLSVSRKRKDMKGSENFCLMIRWVRKTRPDLSCAGDEAEGSEGSAVSSCSKVSPAQAPLVLQPF